MRSYLQNRKLRVIYKSIDQLPVYSGIPQGYTQVAFQ
jgi:hypothetical protein